MSRCIFGANLGIPAQIYDVLSCRQGKVYWWTGQMQTMTIPLHPDRPRASKTMSKHEFVHTACKVLYNAPRVCVAKHHHQLIFTAAVQTESDHQFISTVAVQIESDHQLICSVAVQIESDHQLICIVPVQIEWPSAYLHSGCANWKWPSVYFHSGCANWKWPSAYLHSGCANWKWPSAYFHSIYTVAVQIQNQHQLICTTAVWEVRCIVQGDFSLKHCLRAILIWSDQTGSRFSYHNIWGLFF